MAKLSPEDLAFAAVRLAYEVGVLVQAPDYWLSAKTRSDNLGLILSIESALLHARSLHDFLFEQGRKDDITAWDFVGQWNASKAPTPTYVNKHLDRINKMLAHLTVARLHYIRSGAHEWDLALIRWELLQVFLRFLQDCQPNIASIIEEELQSRFGVSQAQLKAMPKSLCH